MKWDPRHSADNALGTGHCREKGALLKGEETDERIDREHKFSLFSVSFPLASNYGLHSKGNE